MPSLLRQHFQQPLNAGVVNNADIEVCQRSAAWGDELRLSAKVERGRLQQLKWQAAGRAELLALMSIVSEALLKAEYSTQGLAQMAQDLELASNQRDLLLLVEDAVSELMDFIEKQNGD